MEWSMAVEWSVQLAGRGIDSVVESHLGMERKGKKFRSTLSMVLG